MAGRYRKPHHFKKRKPIYGNRFFWLGFLILIFFSSLFYFLFFAEFFQVKKINIAGPQQTSAEQLNLLVSEKLENKILFFSTRSIFLVNLNKIKDDVLKRFSPIASIEIRRSLPNILNVLVTERKIIATFCLPADQAGQEFEEDKSSSLPFAVAREDNCFVLDKEGIIFQETNDSFQPVIRSLIFTDEINLGKKAVEKENLILLLEINSQLKENLNIPIKEFIISDREKLIVTTHEGWEIYFNLSGNIEWQLTKLKALLEEKIPEEKRKDLEYIELRFGNFANPKYKD